MKPDVIWAYLNSTRKVVLIVLNYIIMYTMLYLVLRNAIENVKQENLSATEQNVCDIHQRAAMINGCFLFENIRVKLQVISYITVQPE